MLPTFQALNHIRPTLNKDQFPTDIKILGYSLFLCYGNVNLYLYGLHFDKVLLTRDFDISDCEQTIRTWYIVPGWLNAWRKSCRTRFTAAFKSDQLASSIWEIWKWERGLMRFKTFWICRLYSWKNFHYLDKFYNIFKG